MAEQMVFAIFVFSTAGMISYARRATGSLFNVFVLFAAPYLILVPLNQLIASPLFGMYSISSNVILMLNGAILAFFVGSLPMLKPINVDRFNLNAAFDSYYMDAMAIIVLTIGVITVARVVISIATGGFDVSRFDESAESFDDGPIGHLRLVGYVLLPIVAVWAVKEKRPMGILAVVLMLLATFATFKKNYIFCMLVSLTVFVGIYKRDAAKRMISGLLVLVPIIFFANYFIGFFARGLVGNVADGFYINRFFVYATGSLVYDNYIFDLGIRTDVSLIEKCLVFIFALPNMFLGKLFGIRFFVHEKQLHLPVSENGQSGNVVDAIGYMFPSQGSWLDVVGFLLFFCVIGFFTTAFVNYLLERNRDSFSACASVFLTEFVFFSFFGTFYINPTPWESLVLAGFIPWLLKRKTWDGIARGSYSIRREPRKAGGGHATCSTNDIPRIA